MNSGSDEGVRGYAPTKGTPDVQNAVLYTGCISLH